MLDRYKNLREILLQKITEKAQALLLKDLDQIRKMKADLQELTDSLKAL
jgi:hypothetical protein